jgi:uncharacterized membrane-anchored protein YitT (DUF2179 family)
MKSVKSHLFWKNLKDYSFVLIGSLIQALAMRLFLIPGLLTSGGISGAAQIVNHLSGWPVGVMTLLGNLPLFFVGWRYLGGHRFATRTILSIVSFSFFTDFLILFIPASGVTKDIFLDTLYGGVILGFGLGIVYRGQGTSGGTDIVCRVINHKLGIPISQAYLIADALVVLASGYFFGWDRGLYGLVVVYISGLCAEAISEGSGAFRSVMVITEYPKEVSELVMTELERGVTILPGTGAFTGNARPILYIVITRDEVNQLKALVSEADPKAFMVIGQAHEAFGEGFKALK